MVGFEDHIPTTQVGGQIGLASDRRWPPPAVRPPCAGLGPTGPWAPWAPLAHWGQGAHGTHIQFVLRNTSSFLLNRTQPYLLAFCFGFFQGPCPGPDQFWSPGPGPGPWKSNKNKEPQNIFLAVFFGTSFKFFQVVCLFRVFRARSLQKTLGTCLN